MMNPFEKKALKPQAYHWLPFGAIRPAGWLRAQMQRDLEHGFLGHLDELVPDLILKDDIYGADRLTKAARTKDLGVVTKETEWEVQFLWWNSETQSNWRDGFVRTALLLQQPDFLQKAREYIEHMLATQDDDGYLGIYAPDLRFNFKGENGELWAQALLFRVLLGYYEATGEMRVLTAVRRAVGETMRAYPMGQSAPFNVANDFAGVGHGLVFTDVLDRLYQLTSDEHYLDYALWLYQQYSAQPLSQEDVQYAHLNEVAYRFHAHGVHTYEQLRSLLTAVYAADNPLLDQALENYLAKLALCLMPSGAPIGDEMIGAREADASETGYEYCSIHELLDAYSHLLQKSGDPQWGDRIEWLLFNAGQGARHPHESAITYLKTDNAFSLTGPLHVDEVIDVRNPQTRYKYSPAHQDVAVCCVPNAGRIYPYYVKAMWLRTPRGLLAALYGACDLATKINGVAVHLHEETNYPFEHEIKFSIAVAAPVEFELAFRKPAWAHGYKVVAQCEWHEADDLIKLNTRWQSGDEVTVRFEAEIKINPFRNGEYYLSYGPLLFALPLEGDAREGRQYPPAGFRDLYYFPKSANGSNLCLAGDGKFVLEKHPFDVAMPWETVTLHGALSDSETQQLQPVRLIPMGGSILRRVTFRYLL